MTDANDRTEDSSRKEESVEELNNASGVLKGEIETNQDSFENQTIEPAQSANSKTSEKKIDSPRKASTSCKGNKETEPKAIGRW